MKKHIGLITRENEAKDVVVVCAPCGETCASDDPKRTVECPVVGDNDSYKGKRGPRGCWRSTS